jgi:hypothetical protein
MARTKLTEAQIVTGLVSSSLNNVPTLTPSGSGTIVYSGNNNSITLSTGTYLLSATASGKMVLAGQDSSWGVDIYNGTTTVATNTLGSLGASSTAWPNVSCQATVTITSQTTFTVRIEQTFGTSATISNLCTSITFTKTG